MPVISARQYIPKVETLNAGNVQQELAKTNLGHFHTYGTEFWFVAEGTIEVLIEGVGLVSGQPGDIITAAEGRFHRAGAAGNGMSTRIATNGYPQGLHVYQTPEGQ